jgi:unsaturated chondroitin disaccharide hydrolase
MRHRFIIQYLFPFCLLCATAALLHGTVFAPDPHLDSRIEAALEHSRAQLEATVLFLEHASANEPRPERRPLFPQFTANPLINTRQTKPMGEWITTRANGTFWARGSFAALLWMMADIADQPDERALWQARARLWSEPLRNYTGNDMTVNNYAVFRRWMAQADDAAEREAQRAAILNLSRLLIQPFDRATNSGRFLEAAGIFGYRRATNASEEPWFHAFVDHSPNTEQLLGASLLTDDEEEALAFRNAAVSHVLKLHETMGARRNPGNSGTWQRAYFDWFEDSPRYGAFLFNEGKQGWSDASTWSRGQAWWLYGCSLAYYHTRHPAILEAAKSAARYYADNLPNGYPEPHRQPEIFIPAWDFDYAREVDFNTQLDTSAAAIAAAGLVRLVAAMDHADPDRSVFHEVLTGTLLNLTAPPFLTSDGGPEMSILRHGCYHHPASLEPSNDYDNGLIWGDYFFVDALLAYRALRDDPSAAPIIPALELDMAAMRLHWPTQTDVFYQREYSPDLKVWGDVGVPIPGSGEVLDREVQDTPGFWRLRIWNRGPLN